MKYMLLTLSLLMSLSLLAGPYECLDKLTKEGSQDTLSVTLDLDSFDSIFTNNYENLIEKGQWVVRALLEYVGCNSLPSSGKYKSDVSFTYLPHGLVSNSKCFYLNQDSQSGLTCHMETNLGKFLVYWDDFASVHIIYSRWD